MQLTGQQILDRGIIKGVEAIDRESQQQQQGVDLRLGAVCMVDGMGFIPASGKTLIPSTSDVYPEYDESYDKEVFELEPGYYEIYFMEKCNLGNNEVMQIISRSSLVRCGAQVRAGQFDAGFHTERMGAFLEVSLPITIEVGARVAQAIVSESYEVQKDDLYNGQWQGDKQRNA